MEELRMALLILLGGVFIYTNYRNRRNWHGK